MNNIKGSIIRSIKGGLKAIDNYPLVIIGAGLFTLVTMIRIQLDVDKDSMRYLLDCIQMSLASGVAFGLTLTAFMNRRFEDSKAYINYGLNLVVYLLTFVLLFFLSKSDLSVYRSLQVTEISISRLFTWILICMIAYIYYSKKNSLGQSLFVFQKSFVIALIYGSVLMGGTSGVAGAVKALLYNDMSEKVFMHLSALVSFVAFSIFVGGLVDLKLDKGDPEVARIEKKPKFFEMLLIYVLIPILLSLTMVLILWIGKAVFLGDWPPFSTVMGIVTGYVIGGIWLYLMVLVHDEKLVHIYKRLYPILAIIILTFGLWAFIKHMSDSGFRGEEYFFSIVWLISILSMVIIVIKKDLSQNFIPWLVVIGLFVSVMPFIGYHVLPVRFEVSRLEETLNAYGMIRDDKIVISNQVPDEDDKISITKSVLYLAYTRDTSLPEWFDRELDDATFFEETFGFKMTWKDYEVYDRTHIYLNLTNSAQVISGYDYAVYWDHRTTTFYGSLGRYEISFDYDDETDIPRLKILLNNELVIDEDMKSYFSEVRKDYLNKGRDGQATAEDMSYMIQSESFDVLIVFRYLSISEGADYDYYGELEVIYIDEHK